MIGRLLSCTSSLLDRKHSGIKCCPTPTVTNNYNSWGPLQDLKLLLHLPTAGVVLSADQLSTEMVSPNHVVTALEVNGFHQYFKITIHS